MSAAVELATDSFTLLHFLAFAFTVLGEVLGVVFVYRILIRGGSPASNLLWMLLILVLPWIGLLLYYLLPRQLQRRRLRRIQQRGARVRGVPADAECESAVGGVGPSHLSRRGAVPEGGLLAVLDQDDGGGLRDGNTVEWIPGGEEFFAAAEAAISAAEKQIHCVVYILRADEAGLCFLEWLTAAAKRGIEVRLLFDSIGSFGLKGSHLAPLRAAGGRAEAFLPLLWKKRPFTINLRNHRKFLIIDGELGFIGGRNIANEYRTGRLPRASARGPSQRWFDAMVAVRGPSVGLLQDVFVEDWCTATDELIENAIQAAPSQGGGERVAVACSGPDREQPRLWYAIIQAIGEATDSVELSSPYLLPPPMLFFALELAVARGVAVRVFTNGRKAEAAVLYWAQRSYYRRLLQIGVEIYETIEDYSHSKLLLVDGRTVVVGSANMDLRSAALNFEIAVVVLDSPEFAARVQQTMAERSVGRQRVTEEALPTNPFWRAIDGLSSLLSPVL